VLKQQQTALLCSLQSLRPRSKLQNVLNHSRCVHAAYMLLQCLKWCSAVCDSHRCGSHHPQCISNKRLVHDRLHEQGQSHACVMEHRSGTVQKSSSLFCAPYEVQPWKHLTLFPTCCVKPSTLGLMFHGSKIASHLHTYNYSALHECLWLPCSHFFAVGEDEMRVHRVCKRLQCTTYLNFCDCCLSVSCLLLSGSERVQHYLMICARHVHCDSWLHRQGQRKRACT
jgi:hypothetical protein